jgi:hypothetical protein
MFALSAHMLNHSSTNWLRFVKLPATSATKLNLEISTYITTQSNNSLLANNKSIIFKELTFSQVLTKYEKQQQLKLIQTETNTFAKQLLFEAKIPR